MELLNVLKALGDETRYKLIQLLLKHDFCVGALATRLHVSESAVSQHLKILRDTGIVRGDKRGYYTHYYVDRNILRQAADMMIELSRTVPSDKKCHQGKDCLSVNNHHSKKG
ncbi:MAG TPA: metalloregulator ArsR/SmtB family transcription factor [Atribacterota bacterium]|nr:metalloregulator ArsR/SmtB family transcription factor [Atribacterota bacterium]